MKRSNAKRAANSAFSSRLISSMGLEALESRQFLSAVSPLCGNGGSGDGVGAESGSSSGSGVSNNGTTIVFSQAPAAVQTGLDALAMTDNVTVPAATDTVYLANKHGVESYSVDISGTGTETTLTVDQSGAAITKPTKTTTTFGTLSGATTDSNVAASTEISAIATALNLTAPTDTTNVKVITFSDGTAIYTVNLTPTSATNTTDHTHAYKITVDSNGNPVGDEKVTFNTLPASIQNGLIAAAPTGVSFDSTSTQAVYIKTFDGVPTYTMVFTSTGTQTTITVDKTGTLVNPPSEKQTTFGAITSMAATMEIQTLATADNVTTAIDPTQAVTEFDETNGTIIYSVDLTDANGKTVVITVDSNGNPTVPPKEFGGKRRMKHMRGFDGWHDCGLFGGSGLSADSGFGFGGVGFGPLRFGGFGELTFFR